MPIKRSTTPAWADVLSLFQQSVGSKFVIPVYQRNYVWNAKKEVKILLDDYYALLGNDKNHFLGIVIDYLVAGNARSHKYYVIDGQQRLTTLFLLIRALKQRAIEEADEDQKYQLDLCLNVHHGLKGKQDYKLEPLMSDGDVFRKILDGDYSKLTEEEKNSKVAIAYAYIYNFVINTVKNIDLANLVDALSRLYLVEIPLDKDDNAQQIFESINAKGSPLMATDLIRNYILMCTDDDKKEETFVKYWQPFESKFTDAHEVEKFFRFFVMCQTREFVKKNDVYDSFRMWVDEKLKIFSVESIIQFLDEYAENYLFLYKKDLISIKQEKLWKVVKDYRNIESEMPAPLMLEITQLYRSKEINEDQFIEIINIINSFIIRRAIVDLDTSGISRFFTTVINKLLQLCDDDYSNIVDVTRYCVVDENKGKASRMPDDNEVRTTLDKLNVFDIPLALHCFFDKYENERITNPVLTMNYQIEHIMPQDGTKWLSTVGLTEDQYNIEKNRLGNLTLTTKHDNPAMSNNLFEYKQTILKNTAHFRLNVDVYSKNTWNQNEIDLRNKVLIDNLIRLYPYELSQDKTLYDSIVSRNRTMPKMDKLIEWQIVNKGDELYLQRYKESSVAILHDAETVIFNGEFLKINQWVSKVYGIKTGVNVYKEIFVVGGFESLDSLRASYIKEHPVETVEVKEGSGFRDVLASKIHAYLSAKSDETNAFENLVSRNCYIRFAGFKIRNKVGLNGDGSWSKIKDLIVWEIQNRVSDGVEIILYIGPGDASLRQKWLNFAINTSGFNPTYFKLKKGWNAIYKLPLVEDRSTFENDEAYFKATIEALENFMNNDFLLVENIFDNAPSDLEAEVYNNNPKVGTYVVYDENYHLNNTSATIKDLYSHIKNRALNRANFEVAPTKVYIAYKYNGNNIFDIVVYKTKLRVSLNIKLGLLDDPENRCRDVSQIGKLGNGDYDISVDSVADLDYLFMLIEQVLKDKNLI